MTSESPVHIFFSEGSSRRESDKNTDTSATPKPSDDDQTSEEKVDCYDFRFLIEEWEGQNGFLYVGDEYQLDEARENVFCHAASAIAS